MNEQPGEKVVQRVQNVVSSKSAAGGALLIAVGSFAANLQMVSSQFGDLRRDVEKSNEKTAERITALETKMFALASTQMNVVLRQEWISHCERVADRLEAKGITIPVPKE